MHVQNFLCCLPLVWGVVIMGIGFGSADFILGSMGWQMLLEDNYGDWLVEFFRQMPIRTCISGFSAAFYLMACLHFMLVYGAYSANHVLIGSWLLVNIILLLFTLVTGLFSWLAIGRIVAIGYTILVAKSHFDNLTTWNSDEESSESSSEMLSDEVL